MSVKVEGARELRAAIKKAEATDLRDELKAAYRDISTMVADEAIRRVPIGETGDLRDSIRPLGGITSASVAAGNGTSVPYAGVIEWGWPDRYIVAAAYLRLALGTEWPRVYKRLEQALDHISARISTNA